MEYLTNGIDSKTKSEKISDLDYVLAPDFANALQPFQQLEVTCRKVPSTAVELLIYPNPAHTTVQIDIKGLNENTETTYLQIHNTLGQSIRTIPLHKEQALEVDISTLSPGLYQVRLFEKEEAIARITLSILH